MKDVHANASQVLSHSLKDQQDFLCTENRSTDWKKLFYTSFHFSCSSYWKMLTDFISFTTSHLNNTIFRWQQASAPQPRILIGCYSENNNVSFRESKFAAPSLSNYFYNCSSSSNTKPWAQEANQDVQKGQKSFKTSKTVFSVQSGVRWKGSVCTAAKWVLQRIWIEKHKHKWHV